jgi:asparagine synthase (glutamine-hydrolysing)
MWPVYYAETNFGIMFSSSSIFLHDVVRSALDRMWLATWLQCPSFLDSLTPASPFEGIRVLRPGYYAKIADNAVRISRYWDPPSPELTITQSATGLREVLGSAVEGRSKLYDPLTSDLSGGLDSTSLALLASTAAKRCGHEVHTITCESISGTENEDTAFAMRAEAVQGNLRAHYLRQADLPRAYSNLHDLPLTDEPAPQAWNLGVALKMFEVIRSLGSAGHLSGEGGDGLFGMSPAYLASWARFRSLPVLFQYSYGCAVLRGHSPWKLLSAAVRLRFMPYSQWLRHIADAWYERDAFAARDIAPMFGWLPMPRPAAWYTREARELVRQQLRANAAMATPYYPDPGQNVAITGMLGTARICRTTREIGDVYGVNVQMPYLDAAVVRTTLRIQMQDRVSPFQAKPALRRALWKDVPESILSRATKGDYTPELYAGIARNWKTVHAILDQSRLGELGLVNTSELHRSLDRLRIGLQDNLALFNATLAAEMWLALLHSAKGHSLGTWLGQETGTSEYRLDPVTASAEVAKL